MTKKLKIRFVKFERGLAMQILEQEGVFIDTEHVKIDIAPKLFVNSVFLRGSVGKLDWAVCSSCIAKTNDERDEYLNKVIKWISEEQFAMGRKLEIGEECLFSDDNKNWISGKYAGKSAKQLGEPRFLEFDCKVSLIRWKYVKPLSSALKIDGDIYAWEMEVSE